MMIYSFPLFWVTLFIGLMLVVGHGWVLCFPKQCRAILLAAPRHQPAGVIMLIGATLWFSALVAHVELMEFTPMRPVLQIIIWTACALSIWLLRDLILPRALGMLMLLAANIPLDAAFLEYSPWKIPLTLLAYVWIIFGMFWVGAPYLFRDQVQWLCHSPRRLKLAALGGFAYGWLLVIIALVVFA